MPRNGINDLFTTIYVVDIHVRFRHHLQEFGIDINRCLCSFVADIKNDKKRRTVTDFKAVVFVKQFFNNCVKLKEASPVNLAMLNGDFKTQVFNAWTAFLCLQRQ